MSPQKCIFSSIFHLGRLCFGTYSILLYTSGYLVSLYIEYILSSTAMSKSGWKTFPALQSHRPFVKLLFEPLALHFIVRQTIELIPIIFGPAQPKQPTVSPRQIPLQPTISSIFRHSGSPSRASSASHSKSAAPPCLSARELTPTLGPRERVLCVLAGVSMSR